MAMNASVMSEDRQRSWPVRRVPEQGHHVRLVAAVAQLLEHREQKGE